MSFEVINEIKTYLPSSLQTQCKSCQIWIAFWFGKYYCKCWRSSSFVVGQANFKWLMFPVTILFSFITSDIPESICCGNFDNYSSWSQVWMLAGKKRSHSKQEMFWNKWEEYWEDLAGFHISQWPLFREPIAIVVPAPCHNEWETTSSKWKWESQSQEKTITFRQIVEVAMIRRIFVISKEQLWFNHSAWYC